MKIDCVNILGTNVPLTIVDKKEAKVLTILRMKTIRMIEEFC